MANGAASGNLDFAWQPSQEALPDLAGAPVGFLAFGGDDELAWRSLACNIRAEKILGPKDYGEMPCSITASSHVLPAWLPKSKLICAAGSEAFA